jgi:flagellar motor switch protein FliN/FliY
MTTAFATDDAVRDAVTAAATTLARAVFSATPLTAGAVADAPGDALVPDAAGRAVAVSIRGAANGTLTLLLAPAVVALLEDGPLGRQELVAALEPAFADVRDALEVFCGATVYLEAGQEVDAGVALGAVPAGHLFAAVPLSAGADHLVTLALLAEPAAVVPAAAPGAPQLPEQRAGEPPAAEEFEPMGGLRPEPTRRPLELLHEVEMGVTAELGRTRMTVRDLLSLTPGAVVELDRAAGSPVDLLVNGTLVARGEVVVIDEEFGVRISEIVGVGAENGVRRAASSTATARR